MGDDVWRLWGHVGGWGQFGDEAGGQLRLTGRWGNIVGEVCPVVVEIVGQLEVICQLGQKIGQVWQTEVLGRV